MLGPIEGGEGSDEQTALHFAKELDRSLGYTRTSEGV